MFERDVRGGSPLRQCEALRPPSTCWVVPIVLSSDRAVPASTRCFGIDERGFSASTWRFGVRERGDPGSWS